MAEKNVDVKQVIGSPKDPEAWLLNLGPWERRNSRFVGVAPTRDEAALSRDEVH